VVTIKTGQTTDMRWVRALLALTAVAAVAGTLAVLATGTAGDDLGTLWHSQAPESINLVQAVVQRYLHPVLWTHFLLPVLLTPSLLVLAILGVAALLLWLIVSR